MYQILIDIFNLLLRNCSLIGEILFRYGHDSALSKSTNVGFEGPRTLKVFLRGSRIGGRV
jgi:hypothetical protein